MAEQPMLWYGAPKHENGHEVSMTNPVDKPESSSRISAENDAKAQPSGPKGDNPATAGPGPTGVRSNTPENRLGHLNPSAPEDANTTPGTVGEK
ncbi:MAG: hypothetical protein ABI197_03195 [Granulicella sp.]